MPASQATNDVRLPRAILRRSAAIEQRIAAQRAGQPEPGTDPATATDPPATAAAVVADPVDTNPPTAAPTPAPPPPEDDPRKNDPVYWQQRFRVTAGLLQTERDHRATERAQFNQRLDELQTEIRTLKASAPPAPVDPAQYLTAEQIDLIGAEEAKALVTAATKTAIDAVRKELDAELKPLRDQRAAEVTDQRAAARARFEQAITSLVPDWTEIDKTPGFEAWLATEDPVAGVERQSLLDIHVVNGDAKKVAAMFKAYKAESAPPPPPVNPSGSGALPNGNLPSAPSGLKPLEPGEATAFYKRAKLGKVKDAERKEFEARRKLSGR